MQRGISLGSFATELTPLNFLSNASYDNERLSRMSKYSIVCEDKSIDESEIWFGTTPRIIEN